MSKGNKSPVWLRVGTQRKSHEPAVLVPRSCETQEQTHTGNLQHIAHSLHVRMVPMLEGVGGGVLQILHSRYRPDLSTGTEAAALFTGNRHITTHTYSIGSWNNKVDVNRRM